jgi:hypothetical protein
MAPRIAATYLICFIIINFLFWTFYHFSLKTSCPDILVVDEHQHDFEIEHKKFVLSFSLWNKDPRHLNGAIRNVQLAKVIYHAWQVRVYFYNHLGKPV